MNLKPFLAAACAVAAVTTSGTIAGPAANAAKPSLHDRLQNLVVPG